MAIKAERTPAQLAHDRKLARFGFQRGVSGNPSGRPKSVPNFAAAVDRMLLETDPVTKRTRLDEIVRVVLGACMRGEPWAIELLCRRLWPVPVDVNLNTHVVPDPEAGLVELERALDALEARSRASIELGVNVNEARGQITYLEHSVDGDQSPSE